MKTIKIFTSLLFLLMIMISCEKEDINDIVKENQQDLEKSASYVADECYTIEINFESGFFDQGNPTITVKVWVLLNGFSPGLYLGEHVLSGWQPKRIIANPNLYSYIKPHLDNSDRFRFEIDHNQIGDFATFTARQIGGTKARFNLIPWEEEKIIPYAQLQFDIANCTSFNENDL
ncbi:hypothetical protein [Aquimarina litoralis]|uniref:hypothetical protein n=1 Tax=Aquimarina litoralis TaxID=584605 RepID=UPI001C5942CE|nr:hypothetical protein [Aquimarina litoralis]MBW1297621.1 hypothetical protein [Aquimarina litoralis]